MTFKEESAAKEAVKDHYVVLHGKKVILLCSTVPVFLAVENFACCCNLQWK